MSRLRLLGQVAWWEFRRCWRLRDVLMTLILSVVGAVLWLGVLKLIAMNNAAETARIVVLDTGTPPLPLELGADFEIVDPEVRDEAALRADVDAESLDGLVVLDDRAGGRLYVHEAPDWLPALQTALDDAGRRARLPEAGLTAETFAQLTAGFALDVVTTDADTTGASGSEKFAAGLFIALMLIGLFTGNSYLFLYITGEKQQRVTEQVVGIISPQTWIDGKIIGLAAVAVATMVSLVIGMMIWNLVLTIFGQGYDLAFDVVRPGLLVQLFVLAVLGFLLYFAFFAAIAATIDDPNTSGRSVLMFFPIVPLSLALGCFRNADSLLMTIAGVFPLTAPSVLPARFVLGTVAWWEFPLAALGLIASIWILRRAAGRIFRLGILMHGTEPSWREIVVRLCRAERRE
jgi:ABC-2 type transport system permease protein